MNGGTVQGRLRALAERIDALSLRERALVFIAVLAVLLVAAINLLFAPLLAEQEQLQKDLANKREQMQKLEGQLQAMLERASKDPDAENRSRLTALQQQLGTLDAALAEKTAGLVSPQEMTRLVEEVLEQNRRLELLKIENLPAAALTDAKKPDAQGSAEYVIYRHGMRVEFRGRYSDIVDYLQALEGLPWKVFWGQATLEAEDYPLSRFTLVLYTLSLRQGWMGV